MSDHGFISAFAAELDAYVAFKKNMGFLGTSRIWYLQTVRRLLRRASTGPSSTGTPSRDG